MAILNPSTAAAILHILGIAPDPKLNPKLWAEFNKIYSASKEIAALIDRINNNPVSYDPTGGGISTEGYADVTRDMTQVRVKAVGAIVSGQLVRLSVSGGELSASVAPLNTRCHAYAIEDIASGGYGNVIMKGFVFTTVFVSSVTVLSAGGRVCVSSDSAYPGRLFACGVVGSAGAADKYVGQVMQIPMPSLPTVAAIYFNPDRTS